MSKNPYPPVGGDVSSVEIGLFVKEDKDITLVEEVKQDGFNLRCALTRRDRKNGNVYLKRDEDDLWTVSWFTVPFGTYCEQYPFYNFLDAYNKAKMILMEHAVQS